MSMAAMFKVWDSRFNKFIDPGDVHINARTGELKGIHGGPGYVEEWKLIRSTGLKDKNGVEIYEGDIVKAPDFFHEAPDTACAVVFSKPNAGWGLECCNVCEPIHCWFCNDGSSALEVVGNIHEHPELLEG